MKTECSLVRDLLPLYLEDMVSPETAQFIDEHLDACHECNAQFDNLQEEMDLTLIHKQEVKQSDSAKPFKKLMKRMNRQLYMISYSLIIFFIILGFSFSNGVDLMYNSLIMPIVGVFGYYVFRWKSIYKMPILLLFINIAIFTFQIIEITFADTLAFTMIYAIFVLVGIAIAFLLHFAFRKEYTK